MPVLGQGITTTVGKFLVLKEIKGQPKIYYGRLRQK